MLPSWPGLLLKTKKKKDILISTGDKQRKKNMRGEKSSSETQIKNDEGSFRTTTAFALHDVTLRRVKILLCYTD